MDGLMCRRIDMVAVVEVVKQPACATCESRRSVWDTIFGIVE